ncbi:sulfotransferase [Pseudoalteromonas sp. SCSIO 43201]|uniref:tetratricopeptide repeat-containing sulfotransferase family protein n=1 Tax=Pseudoalteromonas sp. SCSIO 43201 TaxID=2822842 RepID=UPI002074FAB8|nr:tetratricopeptide repeat-containing sulfotransferase family protein [Pseudoalteromonas sp. SCSIO 43201]USD27683.1 sulfotransferase [Pseudoalteromonas sp. SCSIO 43201]
MTPYNQIQSYIQQRQFQVAHHALVARINTNANDHQAYALLAELNMTLGNLNKAQKIYDKCLSLFPCVLYSLSAAKLALFTQSPLAAKRYIQHLLGCTQLSGSEHDTLANILLRLNQYTDAGWHFNRAYTHAPHSPEIAINYAIHLKMSGELAQARTLLASLVQANSSNAKCQLAYSELAPVELAPTRITQLATEITAQTTPLALQRLHHALALEYEKQENYPKAWQSFIASKQAISAEISYSPKQMTDYFQALSKLLDKPIEFAPEPSLAPIFVVGLPRSGTSLMEQILAQLLLQPLGETSILPQALRFCHDYNSNIQRLSRAYEEANAIEQYRLFSAQSVDGDKRFIDKQPFHFFFIDLLAKAFPRAKFVVMKRDRTDTCIANFRQLYQTSSPFHGYSYRIQDIQTMYDDTYAFLQKATQKHPTQIKFVNYESLVEAPRLTMQSLCHFLELDWQDNALHFYKRGYYSATASKMQIRQPLNNSSVGKYRNTYPI